MKKTALPLPAETVRIDSALTQDVPGAAQTMKVVLDEMKVEKVIVAEEVKDHNPKFLADVQELLPGVPVELVTHSELKPGLHLLARSCVQVNFLLDK